MRQRGERKRNKKNERGFWIKWNQNMKKIKKYHTLDDDYYHLNIDDDD